MLIVNTNTGSMVALQYLTSQITALASSDGVRHVTVQAENMSLSGRSSRSQRRALSRP